MAKQTHTITTDDLDGSQDAQTYTFAVDGQSYEVDLSDENKNKLDEALAPFVGVATKVSGGRAGRASTPGRRPSSSSTPADKERLSNIRAWARDNGYEVSDRGRIPNKVVEAYESAHG